MANLRAGRPWWRRIGLVESVGASMLAASIAVAALLEVRARGDEHVQALIEYADSRGTDPVALIRGVARAHRLVLLGDLPGVAGPKRIAVQAIESLAAGPGLDAVVVEVDSNLQEIVDRYLESYPEDATLLFLHIQALREPTTAAGAKMEVFRRVWSLNRDLDPARRIRIVAADLPGWPPARTAPPSRAARLYAERDAHMYEVVRREVLDPNPAGRVLFLVGNAHLLKSGPAELEVGGGATTPVQWLAARLRDNYPTEVYSILVDAGQRTTHGATTRLHGVTRAFDVFRGDAATAGGTFAVRVDQRFDFLGSPVPALSLPGLRLRLLPPNDRLRDAVDAYVYLGGR